MIPGQATPEGTARFAARFTAEARSGFYRQAQGLTVSTLGAGTYLGAADDDTTRSYKEALMSAVRGGVNFIDTSLNYRNQRSEHAVEQALGVLIGGEEIRRDEVVVSTKAGFLVPNAVPSRGMGPADIAGNLHSMAPAFLKDQLGRSLTNLGLAAVDVFYLHNPETQLKYVTRNDLYERIRRAFGALEEIAAKGQISWYGISTWEAFRGKTKAIELGRLVEIAWQVAGSAHRFRFIQLPFNLVMTEAFLGKPETADGEPASVLELAGRAGLTAVASAPLVQGKLIGAIPPALHPVFRGLRTDAQRALQFTRSTPGITVTLAGMSKREHVNENLALSQIAALETEDYLRAYEAG